MCLCDCPVQAVGGPLSSRGTAVGAPFVVAAALLGLLAPIHGAVTLPWIRADGPIKGYMTDDVGRVRIFHGVNAVNKGFPWCGKGSGGGGGWVGGCVDG
jgi:hypothetical protein